MNATPHSCKQSVSEPFRLFFPVGMILGIIGIALWPLFQTGHLTFYPAVAHTRLMIQGFAGCFIFGFLMTAGPRLLDVDGFPKRSVAATLGLTVISSLAHLFQRPALGDALFTLVCLIVLSGAFKAFLKRNDTPPPGFPLAALGLLSAFIGSALLALTSSIRPNVYAFTAAKILLYQGFTLLPIIGVGGFFFPKILGGANLHDFPVMKTPNAAWRRRFSHSILTALFFLLSVVFETVGHIALAYAIRVGALGFYLLSEIPFREFSPKKSMHGIQLIFALATIGIGLAGAIFFPAQRIAWLHAYFVVGLTGVILLVSLRVVFGHSGRPDLIRKSVKIFAGLVALLAIAATARIFADIAPLHQQTHYTYAALCWLAAGIVWLAFVGPKNKLPKGFKSHSC